MQAHQMLEEREIKGLKIKNKELRRIERIATSPPPQQGLPQISKWSEGRSDKRQAFRDQRAARLEEAARAQREAEQARRLEERERRTAEHLAQLRETERIVEETRRLKERERQLRQQLVALRKEREESPKPVRKSRAELQAELVAESAELAKKLENVYDAEWHDEVEARIEAERELVEQRREERKRRLAERQERIRVADERRYAEAQKRENRRLQAERERDERMRRGHDSWSDEVKAKREALAAAAAEVWTLPLFFFDSVARVVLTTRACSHQRKERERLEIEEAKEEERKKQERFRQNREAVQLRKNFEAEGEQWKETKEETLAPLRKLGWDDAWIPTLLVELLRQIDPSRHGTVSAKELAAALTTGLGLTPEQASTMVQRQPKAITYESWVESAQHKLTKVSTPEFRSNPTFALPHTSPILRCNWKLSTSLTSRGAMCTTRAWESSSNTTK